MCTEQEDYSTWTPCEMYGCNFVTDEDSRAVYCTDCGESYTEDVAEYDDGELIQ